MPVVISLLNSFTGVAAACGGILVRQQNNANWWYFIRCSRTLLTILMYNTYESFFIKYLLIGSSLKQKSEGGSSSSGEQ